MYNLKDVLSNLKIEAELVLLQFADSLKEFGALEAMPNLEGCKKMIAYIAPKKKKAIFYLTKTHFRKTIKLKLINLYLCILFIFYNLQNCIFMPKMKTNQC